MNPIHYSRAEREDTDEIPTRQPGVEVVRHGFHKPGSVLMQGRVPYIVGKNGELRRIGDKKKSKRFRKPQK